MTEKPMTGPKPAKIELSEKEGAALEKLAARHTTGQQKAQRARIILSAAEGKNHAEIAKALNVSVDMATLWRRRWISLQAVALEDLSVEEIAEILDLNVSTVKVRLHRARKRMLVDWKKWRSKGPATGSQT